MTIRLCTVPTRKGSEVFMKFEAQLLAASASTLTSVIKQVDIKTLALAINEIQLDVMSGADGLLSKLSDEAISELKSACRFIGPTTANERINAQKVVLESIAKHTANTSFNPHGEPTENSELTRDFTVSKERILEIEQKALKHIKDKDQTVKTGIEELDKITGGFRPGSLIVLASRPAIGKSSFAFEILTHATTIDKKVVALFTLEMTKEEVAQRLLAKFSKIPLGDIRTGKIKNSQWEALATAAYQLSKSTLSIDDSANQTAKQIYDGCTEQLTRYGRLDLVVIDYLQLMKASSPPVPGDGSREREISQVVRSLKCLAKELSVPVLVLSQVYRGVEGRVNKRPLLADLRESEAIEADSDLVLFLYRDEVYNPDTEEKGITEIIIAKNRTGEVGTVKVKFSPG